MRNARNPVHVIILAAGQGTRMRSARPKVMHPVGHLPMIAHVINTARALSPQRLSIVLNPQMAEVQAWLAQYDPDLHIVIQDEQKGTGHAVQCVFQKDSQAAEIETTLVLYGDTPCMPLEILEKMVRLCKVENGSQAYSGVVVGMTPDDPKQYGRIMTNAEGHVTQIVEFSDASDAEKRVELCNSGMMGFQTAQLVKFLSQLKPSARSKELYLVDVVQLAQSANSSIALIQGPAEALEGVNTQAELASCEAYFQEQRRTEFLLAGVTMQDPTSVYVAYDTRLESDVTLEPHVYFGPGVTVQKGARIRAFSHLEGACVKEGAVVGPFARLRPGTSVGESARIGNFVELKNATLAKGVKVNHLSYVGDAQVGPASNIGAGTITCNYDGQNKHQTVIGENVFIGSNTALVAPISIGDGAVIGAGSVITQAVSPEALAVSRAPQKEIPQRGHTYRQRRKQVNPTKEVA